MATAKAEQKIDEAMEQTARTYLADRIYTVLLAHEEPVKTRTIVNDIGLEGASMRLIKDIMSAGERFEQSDRRWNIASRYQDTERPMHQIVAHILTSCGRPMTVTELARECATIFSRPVEVYDEMLPRLLNSDDYYFSLGNDKYGRREWLIVVDSEDEDDVLFYSFMSEADLAPFKQAGGKAKWPQDDLLSGASSFIAAHGQPVPAKILQFFAWRADPDAFSPEQFYAGIDESDDFILLSDQTVAAGSLRDKFDQAMLSLAQRLEEMPSEGDEDEAEGPVVVTEGDLEEIVKIILSKDGPARAEGILDTVLEISPGEKAYEGALQSLIDTLRNEPRVTWVGDGRWRTPEDVPEYIDKVPESLVIPTYYFVTPEGEELDQELEDDGLDSSLREEIKNPLVQDIGDEEPLGTYPVQANGDKQRIVLKYHHKEAGILPLCQINPEFFGVEPAVINFTLTSEAVRREVWMNSDTRLMYDMKEWYGTEMPVSGAVFHIERTQKPDEFRFVYDGATDDSLFVPPNRLLELLELKDQAESQELPTTDIIYMIMERYKQGISFATLFTEVNLVRRCPRRLVASILSSYHAFYRHKDTGWRYDEEKRSKGFNKAKRKYIKKA